jgi:hypothetical protein
MSNSNSDRSIGQLFASIMEDISSLIRGEIALAKAEVRKSAQMAARGAGLIGGAIFLATLCFIFLLVALSYAIASALNGRVWAGFLIVALLLLLITAIMGYFAKRHFDQVKGPERAQAQNEATLNTLRAMPDKFVDAFERAMPENKESPGSRS